MKLMITDIAEIELKEAIAYYNNEWVVVQNRLSSDFGTKKVTHSHKGF